MNNEMTTGAYSGDILRSGKYRKMLFKRNGEVIFIIIFLIALIVISTILESNFMTWGNWKNLIRVWAPVIIATFAQNFIIITMAGVDLSISGVVTISNCVCAAMMKQYGWFLPVILALLIGIGVGALNGILVTKGKQQPIIITLAMNVLLSGLSLFIMPKPGGYVHAGFAKIVIRGAKGLMPIFITVGITVIIWIVFNRTRFGRQCYATGGNEASAYATGIKTDRVKTCAFIMSGFLAAIAGIMLSALMNSADAHSGDQYALRTITAAAVGGTSFAGGRGNILGGIVGVFIVAIINNILNLVGVSSYYQFVFQGVILIIALAFTALRERRK